MFLKIRVSVVRFRPWPHQNKTLNCSVSQIRDQDDVLVRLEVPLIIFFSGEIHTRSSPHLRRQNGISRGGTLTVG
jgi:hypothetical protein